MLFDVCVFCFHFVLTIHEVSIFERNRIDYKFPVRRFIYFDLEFISNVFLSSDTLIYPISLVNRLCGVAGSAFVSISAIMSSVGHHCNSNSFPSRYCLS